MRCCARGVAKTSVTECIYARRRCMHLQMHAVIPFWLRVAMELRLGLAPTDTHGAHTVCAGGVRRVHAWLACRACLKHAWLLLVALPARKRIQGSVCCFERMPAECMLQAVRPASRAPSCTALGLKLVCVCVLTGGPTEGGMVRMSGVSVTLLCAMQCLQTLRRQTVCSPTHTESDFHPAT